MLGLNFKVLGLNFEVLGWNFEVLECFERILWLTVVDVPFRFNIPGMSSKDAEKASNMCRSYILIDSFWSHPFGFNIPEMSSKDAEEASTMCRSQILLDSFWCPPPFGLNIPELLSTIYRLSIDALSKLVRIYIYIYISKSIEIYRTSIEHLSKIYREFIERISNIYRASI